MRIELQLLGNCELKAQQKVWREDTVEEAFLESELLSSLRQSSRSQTENLYWMQDTRELSRPFTSY